MSFEHRTFTDYNPDTVNAVLRELGVSFGGAISLSARFVRGPADAVVVSFLPDAMIEFLVPSEFPSDERRDFYTNRWMCTCRLFSAVKARYPSLTGGCRLWLDDFPSGPGLAFCGNAVSHFLIPDSVYLGSDGYASAWLDLQPHRVPWEQRINRVFWRGASTGARSLLRINRWQDIPRMKLCLAVRSIGRDDLFDVGLNQIAQIWDEAELDAIAKCDLTRPTVPPATFMNYQYGIDIDGNTCSWSGFFLKLMMGITVIKIDSEMGFRQWYYDRLVPWKNFVPISVSMRELGDVVEWLLGQPSLAKRIAENGLRLAEELSEEKVFEEVIPRIHQYVAR